jgi:hypothetical protein
MTEWEKKLIDIFISRAGGRKSALRLRSVSIFPGFDTAGADEKEAYLEAAESLERKGLVSLKWEARNKGERLKTLTCGDPEKLFMETDRKNPGIEAERIKLMIRKKIPVLAASVSGDFDLLAERAKIVSFMHFLSESFSPADLRHGADIDAADDLVRLMQILLDPAKIRNISTRALSIQLYSDSKRLEYLLDYAAPFLARARKEGVSGPDLSFLERSFPETVISGKLSFEFAADKEKSVPPMVNGSGLILGLPFSSALEIGKIKTINPKKSPTVLTIENKETFYALGSSQNHGYDCCLWTYGYPNRAVAAIIRVLASSGFRFFHAGDLDPDGILIFQSVRDIAEKPVTPLRMDAATFDRYLSWARPVAKSMRQLPVIREDTRSIPEIAGLIHRIEETRRGVEQEIIDYR